MKKAFRRNIINEHISKSTGVLHLGAHAGQEAGSYFNLNKSVIWVEAIPHVYEKLVCNIEKFNNQQAFCALITDTDNQSYTFNVSNNTGGVSSSIYEFGDYSSGKNSLWPGLNLTMVDKIDLISITLDTLALKNNFNTAQYDFWVLDLQGAELLALKGAEQSIKNCKYILSEISQAEVYKNGVLYSDLKRFLEAKGFFPLYEPKKIHDDVLFVKINNR